MDFEVVIPDGYEVHETMKVVDSDEACAFTHFFHATALSHADHLNNQRVGPLMRWEVERIPAGIKRRLGPLERWIVVPYQNVLRKIEA